MSKTSQSYSIGLRFYYLFRTTDKAIARSEWGESTVGDRIHPYIQPDPTYAIAPSK
ncbi:hypothetical protein [Coleofasciculus sp.]|uniref:hypothetical protein n=1 Tax=Coleofasciculus sp. TaxID=3100458 RepID=UPI003A34276C